jgi:hypothetical protein
MRLTTQYRRSVLSLALFGALALVAAVQAEAVAEPAPPVLPVVSCPVTGGVDATLATREADDADARPDEAVPRRVDWRSMLPAVTVRAGRA